MDRNEEYNIRNKIYLYNLNKINEMIDEIYDNNMYEYIFYLLSYMENKCFDIDDEEKRLFTMCRIPIEWFLKIILGKGVKYNNIVCKADYYNKIKDEIYKLMYIFSCYKQNKCIKKVRGIDKVKIEEKEKNIYKLYYPEIEDSVNSQNIYFYKDRDPDELNDELFKKSQATMYLYNKYGIENEIITHDFKNLKLKLNIIDNLSKEIDDDLLRLCKQNIKIDLDKIGNNFESDIIDNKEQLLNIISFFYYLSQVKMFKYNYDKLFNGDNAYPVINYNKHTLIDILIKSTNIDKKKIESYIDYFILKPDVEGGINEYPLLSIGNRVIFVPSSFILNDFQFSIINGHYYKNINIINRDENVSSALVLAIMDCSRKYDNIVAIYEKEYYDLYNKYNGQELKSDIDIALYDKISNCILIIECKWKDNVFCRGNNYIQIEDAIKKIYKKQLDKHKYFLELDETNIDYIFDNDESVKKRPYFPNIMYLALDKRVQYHMDNMHMVSEYVLLEVFRKSSSNEKLALDSVIEHIKGMETLVKYTDSVEGKLLELDDDIKIINNIL